MVEKVLILTENIGNVPYYVMIFRQAQVTLPPDHEEGHVTVPDLSQSVYSAKYE